MVIFNLYLMKKTAIILIYWKIKQYIYITINTWTLSPYLSRIGDCLIFNIEQQVRVTWSSANRTEGPGDFFTTVIGTSLSLHLPNRWVLNYYATEETAEICVKNSSFIFSGFNIHCSFISVIEQINTYNKLVLANYC